MTFAIVSGLILLILSVPLDMAYSDWVDRVGGRLSPIASAATLSLGLVAIDLATLLVWAGVNVAVARL